MSGPTTGSGSGSGPPEGNRTREHAPRSSERTVELGDRFGNPLLDLWRAALAHQQQHLPPDDATRLLRDSGSDEVRPLFECPVCLSALAGESLSEVANARHTAVSRYGCGILDEAAIATIRRWAGPGGIIEVGAGTGYNARVLRDAGVEVLATDILLAGESPEQAAWQATAQTSYVPIERLDAEAAVRRYAGRSLLLIWPPHDDSCAARALQAYAGDIVLYVGEYRGCTADDAFHDDLERDWESVSRRPVPTWAGVHDRLEVYRRRSS